MTETGRDVELAPVRAGEDLDWPRLEGYLREHIPGLEGPFSVRQFPNGSANLTYLVDIGEQPLVVRRPTCDASSAPSTPCPATSTGHRAPSCSATTTM
jgi:hypothetical protein